MTYTKDTIVFAPKPTHPNFKDKTGLIFDRLTVLGLAEMKRYSIWWCECQCGNIVKIIGGNIGRTHSCGCWERELIIARNKTHGMSYTSTYNIWHGMRKRCTPLNKDAKNYADRGIAVCERWEKFENFLADMGERPEGLMLERRNNNGNYEPDNCYWATQKEQSNNTRRSHHITYNNRTQTVTMWSEELHLNKGVLIRRLKKGWTIEKALFTPVRVRTKL